MAGSGPPAKVIVADRGYDSDQIRAQMEAKRTATVIPMRKNRKVTVDVDDYIYAMRNRIERCFNKLKNFRRLAMRYDKSRHSYLGFVQIAAIHLWLREFVNRT
jgi:transposase